MKLIQTKNASVNYLAKVVEIKDFFPHPNPEVTKLKVCKVDGYNMIVGINEKEGVYVYFPALSQINSNLLSYANLYRHGNLNSNPEKTGFFEDNGRVKAIKLKGMVSEGFLLPFEVLQNWLMDSVNKKIDDEESCINKEFDAVEHNGKEIWINKKYIIIEQRTHCPNEPRERANVKKYDKLVEGQFRFHYDTAQLRKNPYAIQKDDIIHISSKFHGTSAISANVICKFPKSWIGKIISRIHNLFNKENKIVDVNNNYRYDNVYASRTVVKNKYYNRSVGLGYYNCDVWGEANKVLSPLIPKGYSLYYEIVGFLPTGGYIQKDYDYGCLPPEEGEKYTINKHFRIIVYRITITNADGRVFELSPKEVQYWCKNNGLEPVIELYYGKASDLYPDIKDSENWNDAFIDKLADDKNFYMELDSPDCKNKVPHEGIVIKVDNMTPNAVKLKSFRFLGKESEELDKGIANIEDNN